MGKNTFNLEQVFKNMERETKPITPKIIGDYEIEPTGESGWLAFRYQYKVGTHDYFGYAETIEEAREAILTAQKEEASA